LSITAKRQDLCCSKYVVFPGKKDRVKVSGLGTKWGKEVGHLYVEVCKERKGV